MASQVQNASAILDALADSVGKTLTAQQKLDWAERFIDQIDDDTLSNEEKAELFNSTLVTYIRSVGSNHERLKLERDQAAANQAVADAVAGEL